MGCVQSRIQQIPTTDCGVNLNKALQGIKDAGDGPAVTKANKAVNRAIKADNDVTDYLTYGSCISVISNLNQNANRAVTHAIETLGTARNVLAESADPTKLNAIDRAIQAARSEIAVRSATIGATIAAHRAGLDDTAAVAAGESAGVAVSKLTGRANG